MVHVFEHSQFPVGPLGVDGGLKGSCQLLYGHFQVAAVLEDRLGVRRAAYLTKDANDIEVMETIAGHETNYAPVRRHLTRRA